MSNKTALITGISGQDGAYLAAHLLNNGYKVIGADRHSARSDQFRLKCLGISEEIEILNFELSEDSNIMNTIQQKQPDEIYNLAAQSFVAASFDIPMYTSQVTGIGVLRILEAIRQVNPEIKFYQASSSEMFGKVVEIPQTENTPFYPRSPYAVAKLYGHWITVNYREAYNLRACSGILFNHESPLRGMQFVTKKITNGLSKLALNITKQPLELGNIDSKRDWGFAGDYVKAMHLMLQHDTPDDYVVSTGKEHSVREFIELACKFLDINISWEGSGLEEIGFNPKDGTQLIKINPKYYRPSEVDKLLGDSSKIKKVLNWTPETSFEALVEMMVRFDYNKYSDAKT